MTLPLHPRVETMVQADDATKASSIFADRLLAQDAPDTGPLIVVGLPRSGSSVISDVLSQAGYFYVFDDLYLRRRVDKIGAGEQPLSEEQLDKLLYFLGWQIRTRFRFKPFSIPKMAADEIDKSSQALKDSYNQKWPTWYELQEEWLYRLALLNGCQDWGYNMPGAFVEVSRLAQAYPNAKFLFLFRDPDSVLASYKYMKKGHTDGDPDRYHPLAYSLYWKKCADAFQSAKSQMPDRVHAVKFEDLIADANAVMSDVAAVFSLPSPKPVELPPPNTSFEGVRKELSGLERNILSKTLKGRENELGYTIPTSSARLADAGDLLGTSFKFTRFQISKALGDGGRLKQFTRVLKKN